MEIKQDKIKKNIFSGSLKYIDDYKTETYTDEKGHKRQRVIYTGPYGYITESRKAYITKLVLLYSITLLLIVSEFIAMTVPEHSTVGFIGCTLPIVSSFAPLLFLVFGLTALPIKDMKLKKDQYYHGIIRIFKSAAAVAVFVAVAIISGIIYRIVNHDSMVLHGDLMYGIFMAISLITAILVIVIARQIKINDIDIVSRR